jgi:hypothetical protein
MLKSHATSWIAWILVLGMVTGLFSSCSSRRRESPVRAYNPCGELQTHLLELQHIDDELASPDLNLDRQKELQERKLYLHRQDERLKQDCGR